MPLPDQRPKTMTPAVDPIAEGQDRGDAVPLDFMQLGWEARLAHIEETMREMSTYEDPQQMVRNYGRRMRGTVGPGHTISISRRDLAAPLVRVTRSTLWKEVIDPWKQRDRLPVFDRGILSELIWGDKPAILPTLALDAGDPAADLLRHAKSLIAIPHFEDGKAINMVVHTSFQERGFDPEKFPELVLTSNLFGRATKNLALSRDLREAYNALDAELRSVQEIQMSLLPREQPAIPTLEVATHYQTSTRAGGDYYDFFELAGGKWGILVADVSGHGTPAAVLMAIVHSIAHLMPGDPWPPHRAMEFVNRALASRYTRGSGAFVTMLYGVYDPASRVLSFANAGHPAPLVLGTDGRVRPIEHPDVGVPLGILDDTTYATHEVRLEPGEVIVMYTDGITEAFNLEGKMFGEARLIDAIIRGGGCHEEGTTSADCVLGAIIEDLGNFAGLASRSDDRTLVVGAVT